MVLPSCGGGEGEDEVRSCGQVLSIMELKIVLMDSRFEGIGGGSEVVFRRQKFERVLVVAIAVTRNRCDNREVAEREVSYIRGWCG
jgi:hypothetical protein